MGYRSNPLVDLLGFIATECPASTTDCIDL